VKQRAAQVDILEARISEVLVGEISHGYEHDTGRRGTTRASHDVRALEVEGQAMPQPLVVYPDEAPRPLNVVGERITVLASGAQTGGYEISARPAYCARFSETHPAGRPQTIPAEFCWSGASGRVRATDTARKD
jgi:hypothetical protein